MSTNIPAVKKGDKIVVGKGRGGYRPMTCAEVDTWYKDHSGIGEDGETRVLMSAITHVELTGPVTVVRARIRAPNGYYGRSAIGWSEVQTEDGQLLMLRRHVIVGISRA
jgi:hypothetical protein